MYMLFEIDSYELAGKLGELAREVKTSPSLRSWERLRAVFTTVCIMADVDGSNEDVIKILNALRENALEEDVSETAIDAFNNYMLTYVG